jgi:hypothetical protein
MNHHNGDGADNDFRLMMDDGCNGSTGEAYSSLACDSTFGVSRGPCKPIFLVDCSIYMIWKLILIADFSANLTGRTDFDCRCFVYVIWTHDIDY